MSQFNHVTPVWLCRATAAAALAIAFVAAQAAPLKVRSSGTYELTAPTSFFAAPGATWSFSFTVDDQPVPVPVPAPYTETGF